MDHEQSGRDGRDGGHAWAQQHRLPLTSADLAIVTAEGPVCQQRTPKPRPQCGTNLT